MWSNSSIYSYLFPPSFQKDLIFLDLVFSVVVKCRIFKYTKVGLSMSQKEAAFYNKLKPLPFRVLKLLIYSVVGILGQLSSASPPVILQWLFILSGSWVACPCTVALCLVLLRQAVVLASRQRRQMFMAASPGPLNSTYSGWNVTSVVASCWLDFFKSWFRYIILAGKFFFFGFFLMKCLLSKPQRSCWSVSLRTNSQVTILPPLIYLPSSKFHLE